MAAESRVGASRLDTTSKAESDFEITRPEESVPARAALYLESDQKGGRVKLCFGAVLLSCATLLAQEAPPPAEAAQEAPADQPEYDYGGPAILSRGGGPSVSRPGELARFRPFLNLNAIYDTGLAGANLDSSGRVPYSEGYGAELTYGVVGAHTWKRSALDLDYRGSFRHYTRDTYYDGVDNSLMLDYARQLSPRLSIMVSEAAARYTRAFDLPMSSLYGTGFLGYDPNISGMMGNSLFDTPTTSTVSSGYLIYQLTARNSFSFGGSGFFVRRRSESLIGANGYNARGDWSHRLTRYQTIGLAYHYGHYDYQHRYGQSDMHGVSLNYSVRAGRRWELAFSAGGLRIESVRLIQVLLDPLISQLLGTPYGVSKFYGVSYIPNYGARISRSFRRSTATLGANRSVLAGNGIYLTSSYQSAFAGFSYSGVRWISLQGGANYSQFSGLTQTLGKYRSYSASGGFTGRLSRYFSLTGRVDARRYNVQNSLLNRVFYRGSLGIALTPGDYPLALW
jgi:hypothetical protein